MQLETRYERPQCTTLILNPAPARKLSLRGVDYVIPNELEAEQLAHLIADVLDARGEDGASKRVAGEVKKLCDKFPVYGV